MSVRNNYKLKNSIILHLIMFSIILLGCDKSFLDEKSSSNIVVPETLEDYQQLLDYEGINKTSALPLLSCDDYFIATYEDFLASNSLERNTYTWDTNTFGEQTVSDDWNLPYVSIFYANSILSGINKFSKLKDQSVVNAIKGQALFARGFAFFDLVKNFSKPYDKQTASMNLGIPLKMSPNIDEPVSRSTVEQTYKQIILDFEQSIVALPAQVFFKSLNRPSKAAAFGMLSKVYLSMREYQKAELYADSSLLIHNTLVDYNSLDKLSNSPFALDNPEIVFRSLQNSTGFDNALYNPYTNIGISTPLIELYEEFDLRKQLFFYEENGLIKPKRGYSASTDAPFTGVATDELFLIKAECAARRNDPVTSLKFLNELLINRIETNHYKPLESLSGIEVLSKVLIERRKELVWRGGSRWEDLRRLNKDGAEISISRTIGDVTYTLLPNDIKYTFPIPTSETYLSGITQNNR